MASIPAEARIIEISRVAPPPGSVAETSLPLTFFDVIWLFLDPVERVFFYEFPHSTSHFLDHFLPKLKSSLSLTLQRFYPLASKLRRSARSEEQYEIHYAEGDSVEFTVSEMDDDFDELCGSGARDIARLMELIPHLPRSLEDQPLLAVQATVFPGRGFTVAVAVHHSTCDGTGTVQFLSSWASACLSGGSTLEAARPPLLDRTLISDPLGLYSLYYRTMSSIFAANKPPPTQSTVPRELVMATFTLRSDDVKKLKGLISGKSTEGDSSSHVSTIVVVFAYAWICSVKARKLPSQNIAHLAFPADCRGSLQPPLPPAYFGNCVGCCFSDVKVEDMLDEEEGFVKAAKAVGQTIKEFKEDAMRDCETWLEKFKSIIPEQPLTVAGSPRFRVYDLNFGCGRPKKVEITSVSKTGAIALAESREDRGGVEIGIVLPKDEMEVFSEKFSGGLD